MSGLSWLSPTGLHSTPRPVPLQNPHASIAGCSLTPLWDGAGATPSVPALRAGRVGVMAPRGGLLVSEGREPSGVGPGNCRPRWPMGVLAQGTGADSSPGAPPSCSRASAALALETRLSWCCRRPQAPVPPTPDSGTGGPWRMGRGLGGLRGTGDWLPREG